MEVVQLLGSQGFWQHQVLREVWQPVMANTLQYSCLENPSRPQSTGSQRVGQDSFFFFLACGITTPVRVECEGDAAAWLAGTLVVPSVQGHKLPLVWELWPYPSLFLSLL